MKTQTNSVPIEEGKMHVFSEIWGMVNDKYPFLGERDIDWLKTKEEYARRVENIHSYGLLYKLMNEMLEELGDAHTKIAYSPWFNEAPYAYAAICCGGEMIIAHVFEPDSKVSAGMKILSIDGVSIEVWKERMRKRFPRESDNVRNYILLAEISMGAPGSRIEITASNGSDVASSVFSTQNMTTQVESMKMLHSDSVQGSGPLSLCATRILTPDIGLIKIMTFMHKDIVRQFKRALVELKDVSSLIVDVRANQGGYLEETLNAVSLLLDETRLLGYRVSREGVRHPMSAASAKDKQLKYRKLIVLCDELTMSTAEYVFVKALKGSDDRVKIVGSQTAGLMHESTLYTLFDGTKLQITTYKHLTPDGKIVDEVGIIPDIEVSNSINYILKHEDEQLASALDVCIS